VAAVDGTFNDIQSFVGTCDNVALDFNDVYQGYPDLCWQWTTTHLVLAGWFAERIYKNRSNGKHNGLYFA